MNKVKITIKVSIILIVLCLLVGVSSFVLRPKYTDQCIAATEAFHEIPKNSIDVIIFGSSHAWRGVDVLEMYEEYGIGAYNYACNWQKLSTEALYFYDSLLTQNPKVVVFDTYFINEVIKNQPMNGEIYYTKALPNSKYKKEYIKSAFGNSLEGYISYFFPLSQFHSTWNEIDYDNFNTWYTKADFIGTMGYAIYNNSDTSMPIEIDYDKEVEQNELCAEAVNILDNITKTCIENNIEIIFITIPWKGENNYSNALNEYALRNNWKYLDLFQCFEEVGLDCTDCFMDEGHLNSKGAKLVASYLGGYIDKNYELKDMRQEPDNMWENKEQNIVDERLSKWLDNHLEE